MPLVESSTKLLTVTLQYLFVPFGQRPCKNLIARAIYIFKLGQKLKLYQLKGFHWNHLWQSYSTIMIAYDNNLSKESVKAFVL